MLVSTLVYIAVVIWVLVTILFCLSLVLKRNDVADSAWGVGIILVGLTAYCLQQPTSALPQLVLFLVGLWGSRLAIRIFLRNRKKGEDFRYRAWRDSWGPWFYLRSYGQIYLLQGFLMLVVGYPLVHAVLYGGELTVFAFVGLIVWVVGFWFEVVSDYQLDRFISEPANRGLIMQQGLWRYSRHPNYFGEITMWWGVWIMLLPTELSVIALIGPLTITTLILFVSGIPLLENKFADDPAFIAYKSRTSVLFPWPPRKLRHEKLI